MSGSQVDMHGSRSQAWRIVNRRDAALSASCTFRVRDLVLGIALFLHSNSLTARLPKAETQFHHWEADQSWSPHALKGIICPGPASASQGQAARRQQENELVRNNSWIPQL